MIYGYKLWEILWEVAKVFPLQKLITFHGFSLLHCLFFPPSFRRFSNPSEGFCQDGGPSFSIHNGVHRLPLSMPGHTYLFDQVL